MAGKVRKPKAPATAAQSATRARGGLRAPASENRFGALHAAERAGSRAGPAKLAERFKAPVAARSSAPALQIPSTLEGLGIVSIARGFDPELFAAARARIASLRELWRGAGMSPLALLEHGRRVEVRLSFAPGEHEAFAASRNEWDEGGTRVTRALVIVERFRGTTSSHAVSLLELASFFERGATVIEYSTARGNEVVAGRLARLGAREVQGKARAYRKWELARGDFERARDQSLRTLEGAAALERGAVSTVDERQPYEPPAVERSSPPSFELEPIAAGELETIDPGDRFERDETDNNSGG